MNKILVLFSKAPSKPGYSRVPAPYIVLSHPLYLLSGDKTFFIAAIMAMKHPRLLIFSAAIGALSELFNVLL